MPAHVLILETVYHRPDDDAQPTALESRYARPLAAGRAVERKEGEAAGTWQPLPGTGGGLLVVVNREGRFVGTRPTAEEQAQMAARVLEVGVPDGRPWLVRPGESLRAETADVGALKLRARRGTTARYTVHFYPVEEPEDFAHGRTRPDGRG
jgi:hypothetical protein